MRHDAGGKSQAEQLTLMMVCSVLTVWAGLTTLAQRQMYYSQPSPWATYGFLAAAGLGVGAFWAWMLIEVVTKEPPGSTRNTWLIVVALTSVVGAMAYFLIRRPERRKLPR